MAPNPRFDNRQIKRHLSVYEKSSLPSTEGRALILPGCANTEVEELVDAGYNPCYIFCVEQDPEVYKRLVRHYWDATHIQCAEVCDWMAHARCRGQYSYIHLDFCGHLTRDMAYGMQAWKPLAAATARLRVSVFRGRRSLEQFDWEEQLHRDLLLTVCEYGFDTDSVDTERWLKFHDALVDTVDDSTKVIVGIMVMNFFFGVPDVRKYVDEVRQYGPLLPSVEGTHLVTNIQRFVYNEPGSSNHMFTVWVDLEPFPANPLRDSAQWALNQLAPVFDELTHHSPVFNPANYI